MTNIGFAGRDGVFTLENAENITGLYLPLAGERGLKSAVTPNLGGDSKIDQNTFLLEPVSIEICTATAAPATFGAVWRTERSGLSAVRPLRRRPRNSVQSRKKAVLQAGFFGRHWSGRARRGCTLRQRAS